MLVPLLSCYQIVQQHTCQKQLSFLSFQVKARDWKVPNTWACPHWIHWSWPGQCPPQISPPPDWCTPSWSTRTRSWCSAESSVVFGTLNHFCQNFFKLKECLSLNHIKIVPGNTMALPPTTRVPSVLWKRPEMMRASFGPQVTIPILRHMTLRPRQVLLELFSTDMCSMTDSSVTTMLTCWRCTMDNFGVKGPFETLWYYFASYRLRYDIVNVMKFTLFYFL